MSIKLQLQTHMLAKLYEWCKVLEQKTYVQIYAPQMISFWVSTGRSYYKIIKSDYDIRNDSAHAFVDKITGDIYKPAKWSAPYKVARYNIWTQFDKLLNDCEWTGGYLYQK